MTASQPNALRVGLLFDPPGSSAVESVAELARTADGLGFSTVWIEGDPPDCEGRLRSPFSLLAAVAERTWRIRLGLLGLPLASEHPIRLAEDATVLDTLSGGRFELALNWRGDSAHDSAIDEVADILAGSPLGDQALTVYPPGKTFSKRIWETVADPAAAARAGRRGSGLVLAGSELDDQVVEAYLGEGRLTPRIGVVVDASEDGSELEPLSAVRDGVTDTIVRLSKTDSAATTLESLPHIAEGVRTLSSTSRLQPERT